MFNFYKVFSGHDMVTDTVRAATWRLKFTASSLQTESSKKKGPFENMGFSVKTIWKFQTQKNRNIFLDLSKKSSGTHGSPTQLSKK